MTWAEPAVFVTRVPTMLTSSGSGDPSGEAGAGVSFGGAAFGGASGVVAPSFGLASLGGGSATGAAGPLGGTSPSGGVSAGCDLPGDVANTRPRKSALAPRLVTRRFRSAESIDEADASLSLSNMKFKFMNAD